MTSLTPITTTVTISLCISIGVLWFVFGEFEIVENEKDLKKDMNFLVLIMNMIWFFMWYGRKWNIIFIWYYDKRKKLM